jgi:hypothetical protein
LHNRAVTGDVLRPGYVEYEAKAPGARCSSGTSATPWHLRVTEATRVRINVGAYWEVRSNSAGTMLMRATTLTLKVYFPHGVFAIPLLSTPFGLRDWRERLVVLSAVPVIAAIGASSFHLPACIGPATPPLIIAYVAGCGTVWRFSLGGRWMGRALVTAILVALGPLAAGRFVQRDQNEMNTRVPYWTRKRDAPARRGGSRTGRQARNAPDLRAPRRNVPLAERAGTKRPALGG